MDGEIDGGDAAWQLAGRWVGRTAGQRLGSADGMAIGAIVAPEASVLTAPVGGIVGATVGGMVGATTGEELATKIKEEIDEPEQPRTEVPVVNIQELTPEGRDNVNAHLKDHPNGIPVPANWKGSQNPVK